VLTDECAHPRATYHARTSFLLVDRHLRPQQHSCAHMRGERGACGPGGTLYKPTSQVIQF